jgi:hypothetical protein
MIANAWRRLGGLQSPLRSTPPKIAMRVPPLPSPPGAMGAGDATARAAACQRDTAGAANIDS